MPPFERDEYIQRISKTKQRMAERGIDVLLVTDPANMNYLTGYDGWSFYTHQVVAVSLDAEEPVWIGRLMDVACARHTTFLRPENIVGYPDVYVYDRSRHAMTYAADILRQRGWEQRTFAVEMDAHYLTARYFEVLRKELPRARFVDADFLVNWVRIVKSPREIDYMRQAGRIAAVAMQTAIDVIEPGVRECDAAAKVYAALIAGTPEFGGDVPMGISMPSGEKTSAPHLVWTDQPYLRDVAVSIELGGCRHRYHSGLARTVFLGSPPERLSTLSAATVEGMQVAFDAVRPGRTCEEVEAAWRGVLKKAGIEKESRIGYSIGLGYPPSWVERTASLAPGDTTVLEPGMTFHMILGMWQEDWGFELSEAFRVTEKGEPELFAGFPRQLFVKP